MGFRLEIRADNKRRYFDCDKDFYGTKFYGYADIGYGEAWKTCHSVRFLQSLFGEDIIEELDYSTITEDYEISAENFRLFVVLYEYDFKTLFNTSNVLTQNANIREMFFTDTPKILSWN